jgi:error-prone DNA polymerase
VFEKQRRIVMGARLMAVRGLVQTDENVIHVVARNLSDHTLMLRRLSDDIIAPPLSPADAPGTLRPPPGRHPRDVEIIPKSRDFH